MQELELPNLQPILETPTRVPAQPAAEEEIKKTVRPAAEPKVYGFSAYHLVDTLKLKEIAKIFDLPPLSLNPVSLIYSLGEDSYFCIYNFGAVVFFNVGSKSQMATLEKIRRFLPTRSDILTSDEFNLEENKKEANRVFFDRVVVNKISREKIELMALALAKSTALETFEKRIEVILASLGDLRTSLGKKMIKRLKEKRIITLMDQVMNTRQNLVATLCLLEKPDETWDSKTLDELYQEAITMFELNDRFRALDYKIKMIQDNLELLASFVTNRQHLLLEITIVALIVIEVALFVYELIAH
ncbi:MAG: RMD1 family protein [Deltaproteobacteria bacterium]|nr:RMD1 family protein [Deltaproteobacteria bacterium]